MAFGAGWDSSTHVQKSNAGDSRAIICTDGRAVALSEDHKPGNQKETDRIEKAGGHVEFGRVNGNTIITA